MCVENCKTCKKVENKVMGECTACAENFDLKDDKTCATKSSETTDTEEAESSLLFKLYISAFMLFALVA